MLDRYSGRGLDPDGRGPGLRPPALRGESRVIADAEVYTTGRYLREMCEAAEARDAAASAEGRATYAAVRPTDPTFRPAVSEPKP